MLSKLLEHTVHLVGQNSQIPTVSKDIACLIECMYDILPFRGILYKLGDFMCNFKRIFKYLLFFIVLAQAKFKAWP